MTTKYAELVSEFKLTIPQILDLTPRQRHDIYGHPRNEDGTLKVEQNPEADPVARLAQLIGLIDSGFLQATPEQRQMLEDRWKSYLPQQPQ